MELDNHDVYHVLRALQKLEPRHKAVLARVLRTLTIGSPRSPATKAICRDLHDALDDHGRVEFKTIRRSTTSDLKDVLHWLRAEHGVNNEDSFYVNRVSIRDAHKLGLLSVLLIMGKPVAFLLDDDTGPQILCVKRTHRNRGYGRKLALFALYRCRELGMSSIEIECTPRTSAPFWTRMGLDVFKEPNSHRLRARLQLRTNMKLQLYIDEISGSDDFPGTKEKPVRTFTGLLRLIPLDGGEIEIHGVCKERACALARLHEAQYEKRDR